MLSLIGVIVVITSGSINTLMSLSFNKGDLLFIAALICGVLYSLTGKSYEWCLPFINYNEYDGIGYWVFSRPFSI